MDPRDELRIVRRTQREEAARLRDFQARGLDTWGPMLGISDCIMEEAILFNLHPYLLEEEDGKSEDDIGAGTTGVFRST